MALDPKDLEQHPDVKNILKQATWFAGYFNRRIQEVADTMEKAVNDAR